MNDFSRVPDCVVGMPMLEWLDMGGNQLQQLPEDIHRCEGGAPSPALAWWPPPSRSSVSPQDGEAAHAVAAEEPAGGSSREHQQDGQFGHSGPQQQQAERHPPADGGHVQPQVCPLVYSRE